MCDVEVDPEDLARRLGSVADDSLADEGPLIAHEGGDGPSVALFAANVSGGGLSALRRHAELARRASTATPALLEYSDWEAAELIVNLFCVYPFMGRQIDVEWPRALSFFVRGASRTLVGGVEGTIATRDAQTKAWSTLILRELASYRTAVFRQRWFGGAGSKTAEQVRHQVLRTINFMKRELAQGIRYVYPADRAQSNPCANAVAYVWRAHWDEPTGYKETTGPVCKSTDDPFVRNCGLDDQGRYYVYLCRSWYEPGNENYQISVLVHEAAHHAGPNDVTYNREDMMRNSQAEQLLNAANYQFFAHDVVASAQGCGDLDGHCEHYKNLGYCATSDHVREHCRKT